jgi:hypothetical protein
MATPVASPPLRGPDDGPPGTSWAPRRGGDAIASWSVKALGTTGGTAEDCLRWYHYEYETILARHAMKRSHHLTPVLIGGAACFHDVVRCDMFS